MKDENYLESISAALPHVNKSVELEWVDALDNLVAEIRHTATETGIKQNELKSCQAEIEDLVVRMAEKQAAEERIKAELEVLGSKMDDNKLRLMEMSA